QGLPHPDEIAFKELRLVTSENVTEVAVQKLINIAHLPNRMVIIRRYEEQQRLAQAALKQSNAELEQFAYIASHDLQAPLRAITGFTQLLSERYADQLDAEAQKYIGFVVGGANRMQRMIADLLTYSRAGLQDKAFWRVDCEIAYLTAIDNLSSLINEAGALVT